MSPGVFDSLAYMPGAAFSEELAHAAWLSAISRGDERSFRATSMLLKLEPGAELPPHIHGDDEECLVLEGEIVLGEGITHDFGRLSPRVQGRAARRCEICNGRTLVPAQQRSRVSPLNARFPLVEARRFFCAIQK